MKTYILYNPIAGNGTAENDVKQLETLYDGDIFFDDITKIPSLSEFIAPLSESDKVIICGGDGTLNRFVNDTVDTQLKCDILYYALGSGNDFMNDIEKKRGDEPFSIKEYITNLPTVEVNGKTHKFVNNVGFGIDGYCCEVGDSLKKTDKKKINYTSIAIKGLLFHYKPTSATVVVDGKEYKYKKVWIAPTMNGRFYGGGMMPAPKQNRNDPEGTLSLMVLHGINKFKVLAIFPSIFKGEHVKHTECVAIHTGKDISVTFDSPTPLQIDGETIVGVTSYHATAKVASTINV